MCKFASFVLTKDREFWLAESDSHEQIIRVHSLIADGAHGPNVLRVEITPSGSSLADWLYRIDQDITPEWHDAAVDEARARAALSARAAKNLKAGGYVNLRGCTGLKALPENLKVGGYLDLSGCTGLKALPENLKAGGDLNLSGCTGLKALPENLKAGGYVNLSGCTGLKALPENLKAGGYLYLPEHLEPGGIPRSGRGRAR